MVDDKQLKAAYKEGGKKGVDLAGMSDMGGVKFFNVVVETPGDDWALMDEVLKGMNKEVDEGAEERKGGAGSIGKLLLSSGDAKVILVAHVPKALQEATPQFSLKEWVTQVIGAAKGAIISETEEVIKAEALGDKTKELFPLKMRDAAQGAGFAYIRSKGLIPESDDDDYIPDAEAAGIEW